MANKRQIYMLEDLFFRGPWESQTDLMGECLGLHPQSLRQLTKIDATTVINHAVEVLLANGETIPDHILDDLDISEPEGKCVDLWDDEPKVHVTKSIFSIEQGLKTSTLHPFEEHIELDELHSFDEPLPEIDDSPDAPQEVIHEPGNSWVVHTHGAMQGYVNDSACMEVEGTVTGRLYNTTWPSPSESDMLEYKAFKREYEEREQNHREEMIKQREELRQELEKMQKENDRLRDEVAKNVLKSGIVATGRAAADKINRFREAYGGFRKGKERSDG